MVEYRDIRLWADRVRLVKRWLEHASLWPDGIDGPYERWYLGHADDWRDRIGRLTASGGWEGGVDDAGAYERWGGVGLRIVEEKAEPPWVIAGISKATWYRRQAEREPGGVE